MLQTTIKSRTVFCKDNLDILQNMDSQSIDLIYLDPPFNKKKVFTAPIGSSAEGASFKDYFREEDVKDGWLQTIKEDHLELYNFLNGIKKISSSKQYLYNYCYLAYMAIRLMEMHRILKDTGSLYFHCDPTMSHYIKLLMDIIFCEKNFRNEIVWHYRTYQGRVENYYPKKHDIIFAYLKSERGKIIKNLEYKNNYQETVDYQRWKKYFVNSNKIRYNYYPTTDVRFTAYLNKWQKTNNRKPNKNEIIYECKGYVVDDVFTDIQALDPKNRNERVGYPTQKPLALLERIIRASSNKGDTVLDPFCGCATTCIAAEKLNRQWIGIDVSVKAYELVKKRLTKEIKGEQNNGERDIINYTKEVYFETTPPKRTDINLKDNLLRKYVYVISNPKYKGEYKIGIAKDYQARLTSYQTSDPNRGYHLEYKKYTPLFRPIEKYIHTTFDNKHEWVKGKLEDIINAIENYKA